MTEERFALDTNVLIYLEGNDYSKRAIAETLLSLDPVIPTQVITEFINVTRRLRKVPKQQLIAEVCALFRHCYLSSVKHSTLDLATQLISRYDFQIFDSLIVAAALETNCDILYSEDMQHNLIVNKQMKIINPFV